MIYNINMAYNYSYELILATQDFVWRHPPLCCPVTHFLSYSKSLKGTTRWRGLPGIKQNHNNVENNIPSMLSGQTNQFSLCLTRGARQSITFLLFTCQNETLRVADTKALLRFVLKGGNRLSQWIWDLTVMECLSTLLTRRDSSKEQRPADCIICF